MPGPASPVGEKGGVVQNSALKLRDEESENGIDFPQENAMEVHLMESAEQDVYVVATEIVKQLDVKNEDRPIYASVAKSIKRKGSIVGFWPIRWMLYLTRRLLDREIAELLNIHPRTALNLCKKWVDSDFIIQHGDANKSRKYELADKWLELIK